MSPMARVRRELRFLRGLIRTLSRVRSIAPNSPRLICDDLEAAVDAFRTRRAITLGPRTISYGELDELANRFAHWAVEHGVRRGQTVALYAPTRIDYLAIWYGLSKIGAATALINNNLTGAPLAHCLDIAGAALAIVDGETARPLLAVNQDLERPMTIWTLGAAQGELRDLTQALRSCSQLRPDREVREGLKAQGHRAFHLHIRHHRPAEGGEDQPHARAALHARLRRRDRTPTPTTGSTSTLPLYHATGGLCGVGAALLNGGSVVLRRRFSATHFWSDIGDRGLHDVRLYRRALPLPRQSAADSRTSRRTSCASPSATACGRRSGRRFSSGSGCRTSWSSTARRKATSRCSIWTASPARSGASPPICAAASTSGSARFDVETETLVRGANGLGIEAGAGEIGECVGEINAWSAHRLLGLRRQGGQRAQDPPRPVQARRRLVPTGDLMRQDRDGLFLLRRPDRRHLPLEGRKRLHRRGRAGAVRALPGVHGGQRLRRQRRRPRRPRRHGALVVDKDFDIATLAAAVDDALPAYARPVFVRLERAIAITGTFKHRKVDLVAEGFDPAKVKRPLYVHTEAGYAPVTAEVAAQIASGAMRV